MSLLKSYFVVKCKTQYSFEYFEDSAQAGSYQVVHMVQCTTNNSSYYWEVVQCTTKIFDATVKKWCKIKSNIT